MKKGIIGILSGAVGLIAGAITVKEKTSKVISEKQNLSEKHLALFLMMNQWVKVKQDGKSLVSYFINNGYKKIAIYGLSYAGETLVDELKGTEIEVVYGIDKNAMGIYSDIEVLSLEVPLPEVDVVIVSAIYFYNEIEKKLSEKVDCPIISLEDILYEI